VSDWVAERTAFPSKVREMALAYTVGDKVEAAYRRGGGNSPMRGRGIATPRRATPTASWRSAARYPGDPGDDAKF
jgi:hypothetical protein